MLRVAIKGLAGRKFRTAMTAFAVVLGVALIAGTYILTDTINRTFDDIFTQVTKGFDVSVTPRKEFSDTNTGVEPPAFSAGLLSRVQKVEGVQQAKGGVFAEAAVIG